MNKKNDPQMTPIVADLLLLDFIRAYLRNLRSERRMNHGHLRKPVFFATLVIPRILFPSVGAAASGDRSRLATAPTGFPEVPP